ncbi:MAG TPA: CocE/NonD family hydrolase [Ktedonobacteraceae bacterium]|jgi:hypothetical protein
MIKDRDQQFILEKNVMVPMRDGVRLASDIYRALENGPAPVLLVRLPYNKEVPTVLAFPLDRFLQAGYIVVMQDQRGRYASEGAFTLTEDEASDGVDTIAWITRQPWSNGNVAMFGASSLGIPQWLAASEQPAALRTIAPMHCEHLMYHYQGGVFLLGLWHSWALRLGGAGEVQRRLRLGEQTPVDLETVNQAAANMQPSLERLPLVEAPLIQQIAPYYFDWLGCAQNEAVHHLRAQEEIYGKVAVPVLNIGGWYDMFLGGILESYQQMKQRGATRTARALQRLVIGPWAHFDRPGIFVDRDYGPMANIEHADLVGMHIRWFDRWLKGVDNGVEHEKPVRIFVMGADVWREEEDWPLPDTQCRRYYLHSQGHANSAAGDGLLLLDAPGEEAEDVYCYDPLHPVPTLGGAHLMRFTTQAHALLVDPQLSYLFNAGPLDQRLLEERADVLCYTTPPLAQPVEIIGPVELVLAVASSAPDTDFTGKLVDVAPDGRAEILSDGILRARYRASLTEPVLMEPGQIYELHVGLGATANVFKAGHRIRLEVSSSNFPRFERNTNTGGDIVSERTEDVRSAINRVYHDRAHPSYLLLPVIERT